MTIPVFPDLPGLAWPAGVTPIHSRLRQRSVSGRATSQPLWSWPLRRYTLTFEVLRSDEAHAEFEALEGFYNRVMTSPGGIFRFDDRNDRFASATLFGQGDGMTREFQLVTRRGTFTYPVQCVLSVAAVTVGGAPVTAYALNDLGVVTFAAAPPAGAVLAWTGEYGWFCEFDEDSQDFQALAYDYWDLQTLKFTTVKL